MAVRKKKPLPKALKKPKKIGKFKSAKEYRDAITKLQHLHRGLSGHTTSCRSCMDRHPLMQQSHYLSLLSWALMQLGEAPPSGIDWSRLNKGE